MKVTFVKNLVMGIGVTLVFFILVEPKGLYHRWERIKLYYRLHPFAY